MNFNDKQTSNRKIYILKRNQPLNSTVMDLQITNLQASNLLATMEDGGNSGSNENKIKELEAQIAALKTANTKLVELCNITKTKAQAYDKIMSRQQLLRNRMKFVIVWMRFMQSFSKNDDCSLMGSFMRKVFEFVFNTQDIHQNEWIANLENSDLNFTFNNNNRHDQALVEKFFNFEHYMKEMLLKEESARPSFADYKAIKVEKMKKTTNDLSAYAIASIRITFRKNNETLRVVVSPIINQYFTINLVHMSCKTLYIPTIYEGTSSNDNNILKVLENICNKEVKYVSRPDKFQEAAFRQDGPYILDRSQKVKYLNEVYNLISQSLIKVMESNYVLVGKQPVMYVEPKEDCSITGCKAPYPCVTLNCNHNISIMAYKGLITIQPHESTEAIKCPYCRENLLIKFKYVKETFDNVEVKMIEEKEEKVVIDHRYRLISRDAFENL